MEPMQGLRVLWPVDAAAQRGGCGRVRWGPDGSRSGGARGGDGRWGAFDSGTKGCFQCGTPVVPLAFAAFPQIERERGVGMGIREERERGREGEREGERENGPSVRGDRGWYAACLLVCFRGC